MRAKTQLILGPPGCGKTTRLMDTVEQHLENGIPPERIAFITFSKAATQEALQRAIARFGFDEKRFSFFKTMHALAFRYSETRNLMQSEDYMKVFLSINVRFDMKSRGDDEDLLEFGDQGTQLKFVEEQSRIRKQPLQDVREKFALDLQPHMLDLYAKTLKNYKEDNHAIDFTDMLLQFIARNNSIPVDVVIVDEAQDLSLLQWEMVRIVCRDAKFVHIAGDDDQAIHAWCGADVDSFLGLGFTDKVVLEKSYRLPKSVFDVASRIVTRIHRRYDKVWSPREEPGSFHVASRYHDYDFSNGTYLLLARNHSMLSDFRSHLRQQGWFYGNTSGASHVDKYVQAIRAWENLRYGKAVPAHEVRKAYNYLIVGSGVARNGKALLANVPKDRALTLNDLKTNFGLLTDSVWHNALLGIPQNTLLYIKKCKEHGETLTRPPRIRVGTIHSSKGKEADNVVLMSDMTSRSMDTLMKDPDEEHRVWYVGVTRARHRLTVLSPTGNHLAYKVG